MELHKQSLVDKREECSGNRKANYNQKQQRGNLRKREKKMEAGKPGTVPGQSRRKYILRKRSKRFTVVLLYKTTLNEQVDKTQVQGQGRKRIE